MKAQGFILVLASVALGAMSVAGCSSDTNGTNGTGGSGGGLTTNPTTSSTASSTGAGGNGGSTTSASTISGSSSSTGGGKDASELIGAQCGLDSDCGTGGVCYKSTNPDSPFGGAVQSGYCSKPCTDTSECGANADCSALTDDPASEKVCVATCTLNDDLPTPLTINDPLSADKCSARDDLGCYQPFDKTGAKVGTPFCAPACDVGGCDGDFECDGASGLCVPTADVNIGGLGDGRPCDPTAAEDPCLGGCFALDNDVPTYGMCSSICVLGSDYNVTCGGLSKGLCAFPLADESLTGDLGICAGACTTHDACAAPDMWCADFGAPGNGYCAGATKCTTDAQCVFSDGKPTGASCTDTSEGKRCLDLNATKTSTLYPLGSRAPGMGGGGGGAGGGTGTGTGTGGAGGAGGAATP